MSGPLEGVRVIELAGLGPAPYAAMLLADLGADVIRVDRPATADGFSIPASAALSNRGKRSIVLDLRSPEGVATVLDLVADAEVLIEGNRPGVAERLGVGPDACHDRNPALVYGRMTGWGQDGPLAYTAGHDINYLAITGALHAIGEHDRAPVPPLNLLGDYGGGGVFLVVGILAALVEARANGRGQVVDAAIVDGVSHMLASVHAMLNSGRWRDERESNLVDGGMPFYAVYATSDERHLAVGAIEPKFFAEFVRLAGIDVDPATQYDRGAWPALRSAISEALAARPLSEWAEVFEGTDACVTAVVSLREAAAHPHIVARGTISNDEGMLRPGRAPRFSAHPGAAASSALPTPGEHTDEILAELARTPKQRTA
jgi:alpha-methylacyl-CoA racemase